MNLARISPRELGEYLVGEGLRRFWLRGDASAPGGVAASHAAVEPLADLLRADERDFDGHEGVFVEVAPDTGTLLGAFVHRTCRGQGAGGTRFWSYDHVEDFLRDGLRLARGMTHKNALAGLWWGGGKGVMARGSGADDSDPAVRRRIYEEYGELVSSLRGCYVTAEDVGTTVDDMAAIFSKTRFTTCIPESLGGSGNPSAPTALGVVRGMEAALAHTDRGTLEGKTVAVEGLGNVGEPLIGYLHERGVGRVVGLDIDAARAERISRRFPDLELDARIVERGDDSIFAEPADILSLNATGARLSEATISRIAAPIVCGAANNQLADPERDDARLQERGILYLPDFLVNRMGIVHCADEQNGRVDDDPEFARHLGDEWENSVFHLSRRVLREADDTGRTPHRIAIEIAERRSHEIHPLAGHRGLTIIRGLVDRGWASNPA